MKLSLLISFLIFLPNYLSAQQEDIIVPSLPDTVLRYQGMSPYMNFYYDDFEFYFPFNFTVTESEQMIEGDLSTLQLRTELALSYPSAFNTNPVEVTDHLMLPYYQQYLENSKIDPIRYVLGLAQTAAVGYMAYRHIKKYGFWK
jgi:hypothetical protein